MTSARDDKDEIEKIPNLELAQWHFLIGNTEYDPLLKRNANEKLMAEIKANNMSFYYREVVANLGIRADEDLLRRMQDNNNAKLKELDAAIKDAEDNLGDTEIREAYYRKAVYLCCIGNKDASITALKKTYEKTIGVGRRIDLILFQIRIGIFYSDHHLVNANLIKAKYLMEQGGDWDRKNRLKAYEGLYCMSVRDFKKAAELFLDAVSTFTSYELMSYEQLVFYTVISSMLTLERTALRDQVIRGAEIQEQLYNQPEVRGYLKSFYDCNYEQFFEGLAAIEPRLKFDRYLAPHYVYYNRAMRTKAYKQLLSSYRSLTLKYMAESFGVSVDFIDKELHQLIAMGELPCKIDSVDGVVETSQLSAKNHQYQSIIKHGDILLNRIQKLSRVINN